ncbi:MAG TPA: HTTM domain-containing protein [Candidatus Obscuribacterales bacterium]
MEWFCTARGYLPLIRRLLGVILLGCLPYEVLAFSPGAVDGTGWRLGVLFLQAPSPPEWLTVGAWAAYILAALYMIFGIGGDSRLVPAVPALVLLYYGFVDERAFHSSFVILAFTYLVAFMFDSPTVSCTRRLIQISVSSCYIFSALHKLHPEWSGGHTADELFNQGWGVRPELAVFFRSLHLSSDVLAVAAWLIILWELFLGIAPWFKKTRKLAYAGAVVLHLGISVMISFLEIFALTMWVGLLAFFEGRQADQEHSGCRKGCPPASTYAAAAWALVLVFMPLRFFLGGINGFLDMCVERFPWSFAMYLFRMDLGEVVARYRGEAGGWRTWETSSAIIRAFSDPALASVARYIARRTGAVEVVVEASQVVNHRWRVVKTCRYVKTASGWQIEPACSAARVVAGPPAR